MSKTNNHYMRHAGGQRNLLLVCLLAVAAAVLVSLSGPATQLADADPASPIEVTKTATPNPVASGQQLTYTITIRNTGGAKIDNLVMTDQVNGVGVIQNPPALPQLILTSSQGNCTQGGPNGNVVTCNGGSMAGGATWTVTIRGQVTAANGTTLNNTASVTGTKSAQNFTTNATVSVLVQSGGGGTPHPDLTINKTGPTSVAVSSPLTYTLTVTNLGTQNATGVKVVDTVPAGVTGISASGTSLFVCGVASQTVTCTGGAVNQGQNATITINGTSPAVAGQITNTAVVDPDNTIVETNELNNTSATANTTVGGTPTPPPLDIKKTDDPTAYPWSAGAGPDPVNPGQSITYKIQVKNNATGTNSRADDVVVTDGTQGLDAASIIASQVVVNGVVGNGNGCVVAAPQVTCKIRSLDSGGTLTITITGTVLQSAGSTIFNTATVTGNIKNTGVSASDSEETTVRPRIDLTITKADSPDPVCARSWPSGGTPPHLAKKPDNLAPAATGTVETLLAAPVCLGGLTYTMVVGNSGNGPATGVTVRDPLPAGLIFDSYEDTNGAGFACSLAAGNVIECTGGSIPAASTKTLKFLLVAPPDVGTITNTVYVDPNNAIFEADETNNTFTQTTQIATGVDLVVWKSDSNPANPPGDAPPPDLLPGTATDLNDGYDPIATRGTETYTVIVDNVGTQDATGIRVRDTLPADTIFLSVVANDPNHPGDPTHGFTCSHDGSSTGGVVECIGGHLLGTANEFYNPAGPDPAIPPLAALPGDDFAIIKIRVFARSTVGTMHNEVRVDPLNEIAEVNELNNLASDDTVVVTGNAAQGAYIQLKITKTQVDPSPTAGDPNFEVAQNGVVIYNLHVEDLGTDPVSAIVVKDFLPTGSRFIEARDTDVPPNNADAFLCVHDGSPTGGVITCTGGALSGSINTIPDSPAATPIPTSRDIRVKIFAPNTPGTYPNLAKVDPDNTVAEGNEFDNSSQVDTTVTVGGNNMFNELNLTKVQSDPTDTCGAPPVPCVATSSVVTYTLTVKNDGSDSAFQVRVRDTLPAGFSFISADDGAPGANAFQCTNAANVINCISAMISGAAQRTITIKAFAASQPGDYVNQAVVDPDNTIPEGNETNNTAQATTRVRVGTPNGYIDLTIRKCDEPGAGGSADANCALDSDPMAPLGDITYVLTVRNEGTDPAFNVTVRDVLPAGTTFVSADDTTGSAGAFTCAFGGGVVNCTGGTIDGSANLVAGIGPERTIKVVLKAPNANTTVTNQASVDPVNAISESNETNNSATQTTTITARLNLTLDKGGPDTAHQNDTPDYEITIKNNIVVAPGEAVDNVRVLDTLPVGLIPLSWTAEGNFTCQIFENPVNTVDCVGDLAPDQQVKITIHTFVTQDGGPMDNEACIDPDNVFTESLESDNCDTKTTTVPTKSPDLFVSKSADKTSVSPGELLNYTVHLSNDGTASAVPVTLTDVLDTTKVDHQSSIASNGFTCSFASPNVTCQRAGDGLAPGEFTDITIQVKVKESASGTILNTASVPDNTAFDAAASECLGGPPAPCANEAAAGTDSTNADNSDSVTVSVGASGFDLTVVSLNDVPDPVAPGGIVTYTAIVTNNGTSNANGVLARTTLTPDGGITLTHVNSAGSNGFACVWAPNTVDCTGNLAGSGGTTTITMQFQIGGTVPPDKKVTVTTTVDPAPGSFTESDETNNSKTTDTTIHANCASCIDLVMGDILDSPDPVAKDSIVTFTVGIGNAGDTQSGTFDVELTITDAGDIDFGGSFDTTNGGDDYAATAGFDCTASGNVVTCSDSGGAADGLAPGEGLLIILKVHVKSGATHPSINLHAVADSGNSVSEGTFESNNDANESTTLLP